MTMLVQTIRSSFDHMGQYKNSAKPSAKKRAVPAQVRVIGFMLNLVSLFHLKWAATRLSNMWFTVYKPKPRAWVHAFWTGADRRLEIHLTDKSVPVYLWGQGPLVVCMHGWSGSGTQFRKLIPELVKSGFQVAVFDAPGHGLDPDNQSHLLDFSNSLIEIQQQIAPIHAVVAHSFGAMATLMASYQGLYTNNMIFIAPGLDVEEIFQSYSEMLNLNPRLAAEFHSRVGQKMTDIALVDDPWKFFRPEDSLQYATEQGLLIYDEEDEEVSLSQFEKIARLWESSQQLVTQELGHFKILKSEIVITNITSWLKARS